MFDLNYNSSIPLYMQIVDQTKLAIANGYFKDGDKFPSVRELSKQLLINQTTVSKAFKELFNQGIIETKPGIGTFISLNESKITNRQNEVKEKIKDDFTEAIFLGIDLSEIIDIYRKVEEDL